MISGLWLAFSETARLGGFNHLIFSIITLDNMLFCVILVGVVGVVLADYVETRGML